MRFIKLLILAVILVGIVLVAVANNDFVTVQLLPAPLAEMVTFPTAITLPLFVILLAAVGVGLLIGYILEWLRERKHRRAVGQTKREVSRLESEVANLRKKTGEGEDDVLALLN